MIFIHTHASLLFEVEANLKNIQVSSNHNDITTTMIFIRTLLKTKNN